MVKMVLKKRLSVILIATVIGVGTIYYTPHVLAEGIAAVQETQAASTLSKLEIEGVILDKGFSADVMEYSATVENDVQSINLLVEVGNPGSFITVNGKAVKSGTIGTYELQTGENTFLVTVTTDSQSVNTYTLTVTRKQNANNLLKSIKLSTGDLSPVFSSSITDYTVELPNDTTAITITPTAFENTATVEVNGTLVKEEGISANIPAGTSDIQIIVTAESSLKKTYTIHVTRLAGSSTQAGANPSHTNSNKSFQQTSGQQGTGTVQKVSKATLSSLTVSNGTWDSTFSSTEFTYHIAVASDIKTVTLSPTAAYSGSNIVMEGGTSKTVQLDDDSKTIISVVVSNGDDDRKTYVLVFDKQE